MAVILANNRLCLFRQRNIDCSVRFLTVIDQPPIRNVGRGQIGNIHERYATASTKTQKYRVQTALSPFPVNNQRR